jgi:hypothetical protein
VLKDTEMYVMDDQIRPKLPIRRRPDSICVLRRSL